MKIHILLFAALLSSYSLTWAQEDSAGQEASGSDPQAEELIYRTRQFINLTIGIEQDIKLPTLPPDFELKGDFRRITSAAYNKQLNILRLNPRAEGFATLAIHDKRNGKLVAEYRVDVKKSKLDKVVREMRALLGDIEGISIKVVNNRVVVDGQVLLPKDMSRIYSVVTQFGEQASSIVTLSPLAQKKIAEFISRDINNPEIEVRAVNDKIVLQGYANNKDEKDRAETIAKMYLPDRIIDEAEAKGVISKRKPTNDGIINMIVVKDAPAEPPAKMIQLVVHFVELSKDYSKAFKFQFTPELSDNSSMTISSGTSGNGGGGVVTSLTGVVSNLLPKLNWAKDHGHARVLESTSLIVEDRKKGTINQTTQVPYKVISPTGAQGTQFANVGIVSSITPRLMGEKSSSIQMEMNFEVSNLLSITDAGPMMSQNKVDTQITVRDRQSAAIGGIIRNTSATDYNRLPANVKNPIVTLYASKSYQRKQSQFVVFVTPVVKTSASAGSEQVKKKFRLHE